MENNNILKSHWTFSAVKKTIAEHGEQELFTCASGVTPSGIIHIGNFREIITVDLVTRALRRFGKKARHLHSWDDNDVFRKVPKNMPKQDYLETQLRKCIVDINDPYEEYSSYAEKHMKDVEKSIIKVGIKPEYKYQSKKYRNCDYAEQIKESLKATEDIKEILNEFRKEPLNKEWLPVTIFCDSCQKDTLIKIEYKEPYELYYECECKHKETFDFRKKGITKLKWRVDWPMRWKYENVHFEPGGKDHSSPGGSFDTGKRIIEKIWNKKPPSYLMYDFIRIKGCGGKISSSSGDVITLNDVLEIYEPEIVRFLFAGTKTNTEFAISFDTDVIKIYEDYDKCERISYGIQKVKEKEFEKQKMIYDFSQIDENIENQPKECPIQIGFRKISTILQIKNLDENATFEYFKDQVKTKYDETKLRTRIKCVKNWIEKYADDQFKFIVKEQKDVDYYNKLNEVQKEMLKDLTQAINNNEDQDLLASAIFEIPKKYDQKAEEFFKICYQLIIGKDKGPKLANFILQIGKEKIISLL